MRVGYVRAETVVHAGKVEVTLWCGRCDYRWSGITKDTKTERPKRDPKSRR